MASPKWLFKITFPCITPPRPKSLPAIDGEGDGDGDTTSNSTSPTSPSPPPIGPDPGPKDDDGLKEVFDHLDVDKDGKISSTELIEYFASVGESLSHKVAERVVNEFDSDGDELLDFGDFVKLMKQDKSEELEDVLKSAFEMFEVEKGCGCITPKGLQQMLRQLGDVKSHDECAAMIRPFDLDGNGFLDFHEFQQMMSPAS